jgi:hypothetical protein
MSNELMMSIKNSLAAIPGGVDEDTRAVAGRSTNNSKRISIKGGVFRKIVGGKEVGAIEDRHMDIIFVKMAHNAARTFYSQGYKEGEKISPACWSTDGNRPDETVKTPFAASCDKCPNSVRGSGQSGMGAACRLSWRTAVVLPNDPSGDVMQLVLPATSVFGKEEGGKYPFKAYIQMLDANGVSAGRVITKMSFDTKSPVPKLLFAPVSQITAESVEALITQSKSVAAETAIKLTVFQQDEVGSVAQAEMLTTSELPDLQEPTLRQSDKPQVNGDADVSDVVKKWSKKK